MAKNNHKTAVCQICNETKNASEIIPASLIRGPITERIKAAYPDWSPNSHICLADLNKFRSQYIEDVIKEDKGELTDLEKQVVQSLSSQELLTKNLNKEYESQITLGGRLADKIAEFGGSWNFIGIFGGVLLLWVLVNTVLVLVKPFDPYPFIFLNLVLSCLAAIQAPVIMMSQNRQEAKDRIRSENDYTVNLKAEVEIRQLHEKIDHLLVNQWQKLLEIQSIQTELMEELSERRSRNQ